MRQLNQLPRRAPTRELSERGTLSRGQRIGQGREDPGRHRLFQKRREWSVGAVMVPKTPGEKPPGLTLSQAQAGGVRGGALAFGKFSDCACRALGKNVRRRGPPRVKSRKLRSGEQPPAGQTTASVSEGQPSHQAGQPPPPLCRAAATSMAVDRRWALGGSAEVGPAPVWRAAPRARAPRPSAPRQRLPAAQELSSMAVGSGEWGSKWGVGPAGRGQGQQRGAGPYPPGLAAANH